MAVRSSELAWIVVKDIDQARRFFTEKLGLKEISYSEEHGWAEMIGKEGGSCIGVARASGHSPIQSGQNAVITLTVDNLDQTLLEMKKKQVKLVGEVIEIPKHVKMHLIQDDAGNYLQLVEML